MGQSVNSTCWCPSDRYMNACLKSCGSASAEEVRAEYEKIDRVPWSYSNFENEHGVKFTRHQQDFSVKGLVGYMDRRRGYVYSAAESEEDYLDLVNQENSGDMMSRYCADYALTDEDNVCLGLNELFHIDFTAESEKLSLEKSDSVFTPISSAFISAMQWVDQVRFNHPT
jgi:hypothetical protein